MNIGKSNREIRSLQETLSKVVDMYVATRLIHTGTAIDQSLLDLRHGIVMSEINERVISYTENFNAHKARLAFLKERGQDWEFDRPLISPFITLFISKLSHREIDLLRLRAFSSTLTKMIGALLTQSLILFRG